MEADMDKENPKNIEAKEDETKFVSSIVVYPLKGYNSFLSLGDAIKCVESRDPNNSFLAMTAKEQEAILISNTDRLKELYYIPSDNLLDELVVCTEVSDASEG